MTAASIHARLTLEMSVSTETHGFKTETEAKKGLAAYLRAAADRLEGTNERDFVATFTDDIDGSKLGFVSFCIRSAEQSSAYAGCGE